MFKQMKLLTLSNKSIKLSPLINHQLNPLLYNILLFSGLQLLVLSQSIDFVDFLSFFFDPLLEHLLLDF